MPQPSIFYGDSTGAVVHLKCGLPEQHTARVLGSKDYEILHQEHTDWVTQVGRDVLRQASIRAQDCTGMPGGCQD